MRKFYNKIFRLKSLSVTILGAIILISFTIIGCLLKTSTITLFVAILLSLLLFLVSLYALMRDYSMRSSIRLTELTQIRIERSLAKLPRETASIATVKLSQALEKNRDRQEEKFNTLFNENIISLNANYIDQSVDMKNMVLATLSDEIQKVLKSIIANTEKLSFQSETVKESHIVELSNVLSRIKRHAGNERALSESVMSMRMNEIVERNKENEEKNIFRHLISIQQLKISVDNLRESLETQNENTKDAIGIKNDD